MEMNYQKWINPNINIECYILNVCAPKNALGEKTNDAKLRQNGILRYEWIILEQEIKQRTINQMVFSEIDYHAISIRRMLEGFFKHV